MDLRSDMYVRCSCDSERDDEKKSITKRVSRVEKTV